MLSKEHIFSGNPLSCKSLLLCTKHKGLSQALLGQNPKMHVAQVYIQVCQISPEIQNKSFLFHDVWIATITGHISKKIPPVTIFEGSFGGWSCPALPQPEPPQVLRLQICLPLQPLPHLGSTFLRVTKGLKTYRKNISKSHIQQKHFKLKLQFAF